MHLDGGIEQKNKRIRKWFVLNDRGTELSIVSKPTASEVKAKLFI